MNKFLLFLISFVLLTLRISAQSVIYVDATATGTNNGSNWANAFTELADAIAYANDSLVVRRINIAEGTYKPQYFVDSFTTDDRHKTFVIKRSSLSLYGGYEAGGSNVRNINVFSTVLSGDIGIPNDSLDNCNWIIAMAGNFNRPIDSITIDGLKIKNAYSNSTYGATINGIVGYMNRGGGIYAVGVRELNLTSVELSNNYSATAGAAIYSSESITNLRQIRFSHNHSRYSGGAVFLSGRYHNFIDVIFQNNVSDSLGGALYCGASISLTRSSFIGNSASVAGAAYFINSFNSSSPLSNCLFDSNIATTYGAAIVSRHALDFHILQSKFVNNRAPNGIIYIYNHSSQIVQSTRLYSSEFGDNIVDTASGALIYSALDLRVVNNTFANNVAKYAINMSKYNDILSLHNNVIFNNKISELFTASSSRVYITYNYIENLDLNRYSLNLNTATVVPYFVNIDSSFATSDYRLQYCSPLIEAGNNSDYPVVTHQRVYGNRIDIGAYEKWSDHNPIFSSYRAANYHQNNLELMPTVCDSNGWTSYFNPDESIDFILLEIKWGSNPDSIKKNAKVYVNFDSSQHIRTNSTKGLATLSRYWNVDLGANELVSPVDVRFVYTNEDFDLINSSFRNASLIPDTKVIWFANKDRLFNPNTQLTIDAVNDGNYQVLSPSIYTPGYGSSVALFRNLTSLKGGTAIIKASDRPTSLDDVHNSVGISVFPNPCTTMLTVSNQNNKSLELKATVYDITGKKVYDFDLSNEVQINVSTWANGIYFINTNVGGYMKFVKQN